MTLQRPEPEPTRTMDFEEIKQILALVKEHELAEFELAHQDFKIRIRKDTAVQTVVAAPLPICPA